MEGSSYNKNVANYEILAEYYDYLLQDKESLDYWLKYIYDSDFNTALELASGSAMITGIIKDNGKDIIASDISNKMKDVAKNNFDGEYLILDMRDFNLNKTFDLIFCIVDSINYLDLDELDSCFKSVYKHLNNNGRFIFDMHHIERLNEFKEEYIEEGIINNTPYQWTINSDIIDKTISQHFTFYFENGIIQEQHFQNVFEVDIVKKKMEDIGFKVEIINDFVKDEKVLVVGYKI